MGNASESRYPVGTETWLGNLRTRWIWMGKIIKLKWAFFQHAIFEQTGSKLPWVSSRCLDALQTHLLGFDNSTMPHVLGSKHGIWFVVIHPIMGIRIWGICLVFNSLLINWWPCPMWETKPCFDRDTHGPWFQHRFKWQCGKTQNPALLKFRDT
jgi:hypothetical protein